MAGLITMRWRLPRFAGTVPLNCPPRQSHRVAYVKPDALITDLSPHLGNETF
jgi:hypothetical protein